MTRSNLITGGAGFIGSNLAHRLLEEGERVTILDNLSRPNVERNLAWLRQEFGDRLDVHVGDVRDRNAVSRAVAGVDNVFHFAAQVAVTTSLVDPLEDFDVNARGTLHVLEAIRAQPEPPALFFTSTNKVYGSLPELPLRTSLAGYRPNDDVAFRDGVGERTALDFHSPYGCSKGSADQYVCDYARSYGLPSVVFRMSCIYGPRQFGTEDQGWVAHFMLRVLSGEALTIYGDGLQTRDLLFIGDLLDAFLAARKCIRACSGQAFNIGGGPANAVSVLDVLGRIGRLLGRMPAIGFEEWRTGDQRYYVSDTRRFGRVTGWSPRVGVDEGLVRLEQWLRHGALAALSQKGMQPSHCRVESALASLEASEGVAP
jgi:CDP-paratose 2-epimerase